MKNHRRLAERIDRVLEADGRRFVDLVEIAGLDRSTDFRFMDLRGLSFHNQDLANFDFTGSVIEGCDFTGADISKCILPISRVDERPETKEASGNRLDDFIDDLLDVIGTTSSRLRNFIREHGFLAGVALIRRMPTTHPHRVDVLDELGVAMPAHTLFSAVVSAGAAVGAISKADMDGTGITTKHGAISAIGPALRRMRASREVDVLRDVLTGTTSFISAVAILFCLNQFGGRPAESARASYISLVHYGLWAPKRTIISDFPWLFDLFQNTVKKRRLVDIRDFETLLSAANTTSRIESVMVLLRIAGMQMSQLMVAEVATKYSSLKPSPIQVSGSGKDWMSTRESGVLAATSLADASSVFVTLQKHGPATDQELNKFLILAETAQRAANSRSRHRA